MKLFVSFPFADKQFATEFVRRLRDDGHEVMFFPEWVGEVEYRKRFLEALESYDCVIVLVTDRFRPTANLRREIGEVLVYRERRGSPQVVPVVLNGAELPAELQGVPFVAGSREHLGDLVGAVSGALGQALANARVEQKDRKEIQGRLEANAAKFVGTSLQRLKDRERTYRAYALFFYAVAGVALLFGVVFAVWRFAAVGSVGDDAWVHLARLVVAGVFVVGLVSAFARFAFILGKSYMVEALRNAERAHAISFGEFYLNAFGEHADWSQVQEAFKYWNIELGSAFHSQSVKDVDSEVLAALEHIASAAIEKVTKPSRKRKAKAATA